MTHLTRTNTSTALVAPNNHVIKLMFMLFAALLFGGALSVLTTNTAANAAVPPTVTIVDGGGSTINIGSPAPISGGNQSGGGIGNGGGSITPPDLSKVRTFWYECEGATEEGCRIAPRPIHEQRITTAKETCDPPYLRANGVAVAYNPQSAIAYLNAAANELFNFTDSAAARQLLTLITYAPNYTFWNGSQSASVGPFTLAPGGCTTTYDTIQRGEYTPGYNCPLNFNNGYYPYAVGAFSYQENSVSGLQAVMGDYDWQERNFQCLYVSPNTPPQPEPWYQITCYHSAVYSLYTSQLRGTVQNSGSHVAGPYYAPTPGKAYIGNNGKSLENCTQTFTNTWGAPLDEYGYYRIQGDHQRTTYQVYKWPAWTRNGAVAEVRELGTMNGSKRDYYTYSCAPAAVVEGPTTHGGLPAQGTRTFNVSECPQPNWRCDVTDNIKIAGTSANTSVMRDGTRVPVSLPRINITGDGVRDVDSKAGSIADRNTDYRLEVREGSSPVSEKSKDPNYAQQFYKLWNKDSATREQFGKWYENANGNRDKFLSWIWSSDPNKTWGMSWQVKFDGEFLVPRVTTLGAGTTMEWVRENNVVCPSGSIRNSADVAVVRSINSQ